MSRDGERLIIIGIAHDELEAIVWRDVLAAEGVPSLAKSADPLVPFGLPPTPGSLQVFVRSSDEKRARWLLGERISAR